MERQYRTFLVAGAIFTLLLPSAMVRAGVDPFELQIYGYHTLGKGNFDPQLLNNYSAIGHAQGEGGLSSTYASQSMARSALELEWGITDKINFAYYLNLAKPNAHTLEYAGSKFRLRGRIGEKDEYWLDMGWYAEVEWWQPNIDDDRVELEMMATFQKDIGNWTVVVNAPDIERVVVGASARSQVFEIGYRTEVNYHYSAKTRLGIQVYGSPGNIGNATPWNQQQQYILPVIHTYLFGKLRTSFGLGFGLTSNSDLLLLKTNFNFGSESAGNSWD